MIVKKYFKEIIIDGFDFSKRFKCTDVHKIEKVNNLSINIFELNYNQEKTTGNII